jgi:hypothetical protein
VAARAPRPQYPVNRKAHRRASGQTAS